MRLTKEALRKLGGLHDAIVTQVAWDPRARVFRVGLEDMYANFAGMPEYQGTVDGALEAVGVKAVELRVDPCDPPMWIYECRMVAEGEGGSILELAFSPGGRAIVTAESIELRVGSA